MAFDSGKPSLDDPELDTKIKSINNVREAADKFALGIPEHLFSMAELQSYLLQWKGNLTGAARGIGAWVETEQGEKQKRAVG